MNTDKTKNSSWGLSYPCSSAFIRGHFCFWLFSRFLTLAVPGSSREAICGYNGSMVRVQHVLDTWKAIRQDTIAAVEEFPAGEFGFRPTADVMTFGEIAQHIANSSHALSGMLLAGEESFATPDFRAKLAHHLPGIPADASPAQLATALRDSLDRRTAEFAARPAEFYAQTVTRMDGLTVTRLEMLQMLKEHELTHRAQLFLYIRMKGMVPATTRRRMAKQAGK
jgi:uncharacterized damage-inducible protein DinB